MGRGQVRSGEVSAAYLPFVSRFGVEHIVVAATPPHGCVTHS